MRLFLTAAIVAAFSLPAAARWGESPGGVTCVVMAGQNWEGRRPMDETEPRKISRITPWDAETI